MSKALVCTLASLLAWNFPQLQAQRADTMVVSDTSASAVVDSVTSRASAYRASRDTSLLYQLFGQVEAIRRTLDEAGSPARRLANQRKLYGDILIYSERFLSKLIIGTASTFAGSGISRLEIQLMQETSPWRDERIRNGLDKAKPWLDGLGAVLVGVSLAIRSNGQEGEATTLGLSGASLLAAGSILKEVFGANEDKVLGSAANMVDSLQAGVSQVFLSRAAYDELRIRQALADDYYVRAQALLDTLKVRQGQLQLAYAAVDGAKGQLSMLSKNIVQVIDDLISDFSAYQVVVSFVDAYATQLTESYSTYAKAYPALKLQLDKARDEVNEFQATYNEKVKLAFLNDLPRLHLALSDFRADIRADAASNQVAVGVSTSASTPRP